MFDDLRRNFIMNPQNGLKVGVRIEKELSEVIKFIALIRIDFIMNPHNGLKVGVRKKKKKKKTV